MIATFIPDVDSKNSKLGEKKTSRIIQFFTKHRGIIHSFVFLILITFGILLISPSVALGFFLGYGLHLFADSFTKEGITPFYPISKVKSKGKVSTGGKIEMILFVFVLIADLLIGYIRFFRAI